MQLSFWAKVDLELGSMIKTRSKTAETKIKTRTRLSLMTRLSQDYRLNTWLASTINTGVLQNGPLGVQAK